MLASADTDLTSPSTSIAYGDTTAQRPRIVTAICELTRIWNIIKRLAQRALLYFFSVDLLSTHHTESRDLLTAALAGKDKKAAKAVLKPILSLLLFMFATSKVTSARSRSTRIAVALGDAVDVNELPKNVLAVFTQVRALVEQSKRPVMVPMPPVRYGFMTLPLDHLWIASIDLGQVVTAAVSVRVPVDFQITNSESDTNTDMDNDTDMVEGEDSGNGTDMEENEDETNKIEDDHLDLVLEGGTMRNLKIKQKALSQPNFRFRRALESRKTNQICEREASILPRRGVSDREVVEFLKSEQTAHSDLDTHYNGSFTHRRMAWDFKNTKEAEFDTAISAIMDMFQEAPRDKLRAAGIAVVGINEYYTSQRCPFHSPVDPANTCDHGFVARVHTRRAYCSKGHMYFHRDSLACQNMLRATATHVSLQKRPWFLQPLDDDGVPLWDELD
ncbi:hypothetical protein KVV02_007335 [Mortierella alpina]|uniref:Cas12f1-like TNB domain-containing protein n=1 Tax=Mortierella alpina TaxID=64518 RepID=A0A9P8A1K1_MORAP|nr:hypothetical protein KVV02_007335 [Mortierella alpina]